jgi:hypothetical protein
MKGRTGDTNSEQAAGRFRLGPLPERIRAPNPVILFTVSLPGAGARRAEFAGGLL